MAGKGNSQRFDAPLQQRSKSTSHLPSTTPNFGEGHDKIKKDPETERGEGYDASQKRPTNGYEIQEREVQDVVEPTMKSFRSQESLLDESIQSESSVSRSQDDGDSDVYVEVDNSPPLSHDVVTTEINAELVTTPDEPDGAVSIMIARRDCYLLTRNQGTSLRVIRTDKNGKFLKAMQDGQEVLVTTPFPSIPTVVRGSSD